MTSALIYARQSKKRGETAESVADQLNLCETFAAGRDYDVAERFADRGKTAIDGAHRPAFEAMLDRIRQGGIDVVVAYNSDRLMRHPDDRSKFLRAAQANGVALIAYQSEGDEIIGDDTAEYVGDINVAGAKREGKAITRRNRRTAQRKLEAREWGGSPCPFGFVLVPSTAEQPVMPKGTLRQLVHHEIEAPALAEAANLIERGASLNTAARYVAEQIQRRVAPGWLRLRLLSATTSARRNTEAGMVPAVGWEPIIEPAQQDRLLAMFAGRTRPEGRTSRSGTTHAYSAKLRCGTCGTYLNVGYPKGPDVRAWRCNTGNGGCGNVTMLETLLDEVVVAKLTELLDDEARYQAELAEAITEGPDVAEANTRLAAEQLKLAEAKALYLDGILDAAELREAQARTQARINDLQATIDEAQRSVGTLAVVDINVADEWPAMTVVERRTLLDLFVEGIEVHPRLKGGPRRQLDRVVITPRKLAR